MASPDTTGAPRSARTSAGPGWSSLFLAAAILGAAVALPLSGAASAAPADTIDQVEAQIAALQSQSDAATEAFDAGRITLANDQRATAAADASVARESAALAVQTAGARELASAEYRDGGMGKLLTFVGTGNPSAFLEQASTLSSISTNQAEQIDQLKAASKRLTDAKSLAAAKRADSAAAATKLGADQAHIQSLLNQQQQILSGLKAQQLAELQARQAAQEKAAQAAAAQARIVAEASAARAIASSQAAAAAAPVNSTVAPVTIGAGTTDSAPAAPAPPPIPSGARSSVALSAAYAEVGKPYVYGGAGPGAFDCSGLTMWAFAEAGISLPHSAAAQYGYGTHVSRDQLQPGDLVFFDEGGGIGHVGIYAGNGTMVDAPHSGATVGVHALYPSFVGGTRL